VTGGNSVARRIVIRDARAQGDPPMTPRLPALALLGVLATPALAQQGYTNPYTGRSFNNPGSAMIDTFLQNRQRQMLAQPAVPMQGTQDPSFRLTNRGAVTIRELFVSSSEDNNWGVDRLGQDVLPSGGSVLIRLPQGACLNDIRAILMDGRAVERRRVDTCALTDLALP
jgi:hypothetical protein